MNERDELALALRHKFHGWMGPTVSYDLADEVIAAGYRKSRTITTVGELAALEDPATILMDYCGHPYQWGEGIGGDEGWMAPHDPTPITSHHLWRFIPLTVLHEPEAE